MTTRYRKLQHATRAIPAGVIVTSMAVAVMMGVYGMSHVDMWRLVLAIDLAGVVLELVVLSLRIRVLRLRFGAQQPFRRLRREEPLLRFACLEAAALFAPFRLAIHHARRQPRQVRSEGRFKFGYVRGALALPLAFLVAAVVEMLVVHAVVPWPPARAALLILSLYGIWAFTGMFCDRTLHPHELAQTTLILRSGGAWLYELPVSRVAGCMRKPLADPDERAQTLTLAEFIEPNVRLCLKGPVTLKAPRRRPVQAVDTIDVYVTDPDEFIMRLHESIALNTKTRSREKGE